MIGQGNGEDPIRRREEKFDRKRFDSAIVKRVHKLKDEGAKDACISFL